MKESVYINQERRDALRKQWEEIDKCDEKIDRSMSTCFATHFPDREPLPVKRRRTRAEGKKLIEE